MPARRRLAFVALLAASGAAHLAFVANWPVRHLDTATRAPPMSVRAVIAETEAAPPPISAWPARDTRSAPRRTARRPIPAQAAAPTAPAPPPEQEAPVTADAAPLPLYATRLAPAIAWRYRLVRGDQQGSATLVWQPDAAAGRYEASLSGEVDGRGVLHWSSRGALEAAVGLAPERFVLREPRRGALAANFERDGPLRRITYSGPPVTHALPDGAQDRLSWLVQLAAVVAADPGRHGATGAAVELYVSGARGDADRWRFEALGVQTLELAGGGTVEAWRYSRAPRRPYDVRVDVWLAPAHSFLPVRLLVTPTGAGRVLELLATQPP
jgi:hypothetical protein